MAIIDTKIMDLRSEIVGVDQLVPLLDGSQDTYVNLDNAASTPPFKIVQEKVDEVFKWYSSVHRGAGFKSLLSTQLFEEAREIVLDFVGADEDHDVIIFSRNTSEALNLLAKRFPFQPGDMVLTTGMEHHSNDLPWRVRAEVLHADILPDGSLDMQDFQEKLEKNAKNIKLVAVTGASNVSGYMPPIYDIAEMAHRHGAMVSVDCAQLLPHRKVDMLPPDSPRHLDFIQFAAHKVYAPLGSGGLVGPRDVFNRGEPDYRGGGTVEIVTLDEVMWTSSPEKDEAGSPNVIGAVALAASLKFLSQVGMDTIAAHEADLTRYALEKLTSMSGIKVYGSTDPSKAQDRVGAIPFHVEGVQHGLVAAILGFEGGIGVRDGCFCAHPYILRLLNISDVEYAQFHERVKHRNRADLPGLIRMSFGCYSNFADVDRLVNMLECIISGNFNGHYEVHKPSGSYFPNGYDPTSVRKHFSI